MINTNWRFKIKAWLKKLFIEYVQSWRLVSFTREQHELTYGDASQFYYDRIYVNDAEEQLIVTSQQLPLNHRH